jgi:hypothetical protein
MIGTVSAWVAKEVDQAPNEVMAMAVQTVAATADDPNLSDEIRTEVRQAVEDIVRAWSRPDDVPAPLTREQWLEIFDSITVVHAQFFPEDESSYTHEDFEAELDRSALAERHLCKGEFVRVFRLVLAHLNGDDDARQLVVDEIGDCSDCWRKVTEQFVTSFTNSLVFSGRDFDAVVEWVEGAIMGGADSMAEDEKGNG